MICHDLGNPGRKQHTPVQSENWPDAGIFRSAALGPGHDLDSNLFMGLTFATDIDAEGNGQPNATPSPKTAFNEGIV